MLLEERGGKRRERKTKEEGKGERREDGGDRQTENRGPRDAERGACADCVPALTHTPSLRLSIFVCFVFLFILPPLSPSFPTHPAPHDRAQRSQLGNARLAVHKKQECGTLERESGQQRGEQPR